MGESGVFHLAPRNPRLRDPWELFKKVAEHRGEEASPLYERLKVTDKDMESL